jgi:excisionase family DNA binding protein
MKTSIQPETVDRLIHALKHQSAQIAALTAALSELNGVGEPLSTAEAAKYLGCSAAYMRTLVGARQVMCERVGRHLKFRVRDLDAFAQRKRKSA